MKPNLETPVFIKVLQDIGEVQVDDDAVTMKKGDVKVSLSPPLSSSRRCLDEQRPRQGQTDHLYLKVHLYTTFAKTRMRLDVWLDKSVADKSVADTSMAFCVMRLVASLLVEEIGNGCACNACASRACASGDRQRLCVQRLCNACASRASAPIETHRAPVK